MRSFPPQSQVVQEKVHVFESLSERLQLVMKKLRGQARVSEEVLAETLREIRLALLEADVAVPS